MCPNPFRSTWRLVTVGLLALSVAVAAAPAAGLEPLADTPNHLVISEVMTGGTSASDEFAELYNPSSVALPLEGLELVYVTASGATISRRADWPLGAPHVPPGSHVLIANEAGAFAGIADVLYASGIAATGGSVALRIQGASSAIDAVGWGNAASTWLEGAPVPAPAAGASVERLPGGAAGSGQDTNDNATDFRQLSPPQPQNSTSAPVPDPSATPTPIPTGAATPTAFPSAIPTPGTTPSAAPTTTPLPTVSPLPTASPGPSAPIPIADVRALPDGATATIRATAVTDSSFTDGGGYVDDGTAGIALLLTDGTFARGDVVEATGAVDDRFSQRTLRVGAGQLAVVGAASDPAPLPTTTGGASEALEGRLVRIQGTIADGPSELTAGVAFDLDDASGPVRVIVSAATGIDVGPWVEGAKVQLVGVLGQRDSTGSGTVGYRVLPRDPADVISVDPPTAPSPSPTAGASGSASPGPSGSTGALPLSTIAQARAAERNERLRVRGVVTLGSGVVEAGSAVIQDQSGAILLRLGDEAGSVTRGQLVEVTGKQSTKSGMLSIQVSTPPQVIGTQADPEPLRRATGAAGEPDEARLVTVRGAIVTAPRRASSGTVSFEIDDGSGPIRIFAGSAVRLDADSFDAGAWVAATGPLGQVTSGSQPTRGYRVWLRSTADVTIEAGLPADQRSAEEGGSVSAGGPGGARPDQTIGDLIEGPARSGTVSATLVTGTWPQLGVATIAWDGTRVAGIVDDAIARSRLAPFLATHPAPVAVTITGLARAGTHGDVGMPILRLTAGSTVDVDARPPDRAAAALSTNPTPIWASVVGRATPGRASALARDGAPAIEIVDVCAAPAFAAHDGLVRVTGIGRGPDRLAPACDGAERGPRLEAALTVDPAARPGGAAARGARLREADPPVLVLTTALAATVVGIGALAWWWRRRVAGASARDASGTGGPVDGDAVREHDSIQDDAARLTLVPVHRERGSP